MGPEGVVQHAPVRNPLPQASNWIKNRLSSPHDRSVAVVWHNPPTYPSSPYWSSYYQFRRRCTRQRLRRNGRPHADPLGADVVVIAVEFRGAGHAQAVGRQAAGDDLHWIVHQADPGRGLLAGFIVQIDGDGIALHRIDIDPVPQLGGQRPAADAGADD